MKGFLLKSQFTKDSFTLIIGSLLAQLLPIALSPIITRLYTPDDIAVWGLYMSIVPVLLSISTGSFELSIMLPKEDKDAIGLFSLTIFISFIISCCFLAIALLFNNTIALLLNNKTIAIWLLFAPISVFVLSVTNSLTYWFNRNKNYKIIALNKVNKNWGMAISQFLFGYSSYKTIGLISGQIIGDLGSTILLGISFIKKKIFRFSNRIFQYQN